MSELQKDIEWYKENIKMMNISLSARSNDLQKLKKRKEELIKEIKDRKEMIQNLKIEIRGGTKVLKDFKMSEDTDERKINKFNKLSKEVQELKQERKKLKGEELSKRQEYNQKKNKK